MPPPPDGLLEIDHVIVAVDDLEGAAARLLSVHGLRAVPGGRHPGHGTANMIVPLAGSYLELMAVADDEEAATSDLGRFVSRFVAGGGGPMALCLRTGNIAALCAARHLQPLPMRRELPEGTSLQWQLAGLDQMVGAERLPFFIEWQVAPGQHPAETAIVHPGGAAALHRVVIGGDIVRIGAWLGGAVPGLEIEPGPPGMRLIELSVGGRTVPV